MGLRPPTLAVLAWLCTGCYFGVRAGPAMTVGTEWDVVAGFKLAFDEDVFNPLGPVGHVGGEAGGTFLGSSDNDGRTAAAATLAARLGARVAQTGDHQSGAYADVVAMVGGGTGTIEVRDALGRESGAAELFFGSLGVEGGVHAGGTSQLSIGLIFGGGVRVTRYASESLGELTTVRPYASVAIEGNALLSFLAVVACVAVGGRC